MTARPLASAIVTARLRCPSRHLAGTEPGPSKSSDPPGFTQAFVQQAINLYDALGRDAAVDFYSSPESVDGTWYVFLVGEDGVTFAHPNPRFIGPTRASGSATGLLRCRSALGDRAGPLG